MSHVNKVIDADPHFVIDINTRNIKNVSQTKTTLVQYDHNSERFSFTLPRFIEGHDMMECNSVQVHYFSSANPDTKGLYEIDDLSICEEDTENVCCTWLISRNVTQTAGAMLFMLRFACLTDDGTEDYAWHTNQFRGISISAGMNNAEAIAEQYADILEQWRINLFSLNEEGIRNINEAKAAAIEEISAESKRIIASIPDDYTELSKKANGAYNNAFRQPNNLYKGEIREGGYFANGVWTENAVFKEAILPVDAVKNGDTLTFPQGYYYTGTSYLFNVFNADGTFIQNFTASSYQPIKILGIGAESFYVTMRIRKTQDESKLVIVKDGILDTIPYAEYVELNMKKVHPIRNKVINCLGDSFTAASTSWVYQLASRLGITCNNYGVASSRISVDSSSGALSFLNRYANMDTSADITIIFGGINDAASIATGAITLGSMESAIDNTTFYGALRLLIENVKVHMSGKKIIGVIPPDFAPNANYQNTLPQVQQACREVYEYYSIPYADLKKDCQEMYQDEYNIATYRNSTTDFHPNRAGHLAISEVIQGTLEKYIKY